MIGRPHEYSIQSEHSGTLSSSLQSRWALCQHQTQTLYGLAVSAKCLWSQAEIASASCILPNRSPAKGEWHTEPCIAQVVSAMNCVPPPTPYDMLSRSWCGLEHLMHLLSRSRCDFLVSQEETDTYVFYSLAGGAWCRPQSPVQSCQWPLQFVSAAVLWFLPARSGIADRLCCMKTTTMITKQY